MEFVKKVRGIANKTKKSNGKRLPCFELLDRIKAIQINTIESGAILTPKGKIGLLYSVVLLIAKSITYRRGYN